MNKFLHTQYVPWSLLLLLCLTIVCAACGQTGATNGKSTISTLTLPRITQPVSQKQLHAGPVIYVALGASDAVGVGSTEPGSQGYVPLVAEHLPQGSHMINLGVSGIRLHEALSQELPVAISTKPRLITIWLVANDFIAHVPYKSYMQDLDTLLKQLRANTEARIVIANLPDLTLLPAFSHTSASQKTATRSEIQRWNKQIATIAQHYNVTTVDLFSKDSQITAHPEYVSRDGFHPSATGYIQLANYFWQAINS